MHVAAQRQTIRQIRTDILSHLTGSFYFLPKATRDADRWLKFIIQIKAPTGWKRHTHFCLSQFACCFRGAWVVLWFSEPDGGGIWGQTSGTLGISGASVCMCARTPLVCVGSSLLSELAEVEPPFWAFTHTFTEAPSQWVGRAVIGPQLLPWLALLGKREPGRIHQHFSLTSSASISYNLLMSNNREGREEHRRSKRQEQVKKKKKG